MRRGPAEQRCAFVQFSLPGKHSLSPVLRSSLDFLLQEALHNPSILPSKDAPLQSSYPHTNRIPSLIC